MHSPLSSAPTEIPFYLNNWETWQLLQKSLRGCEAYLSTTISWAFPLSDRKVSITSVQEIWICKNVSGVNGSYMTERERLPYAGQQTLF